MLNHALYLLQEAIKKQRAWETLTQMIVPTPRAASSKTTGKAAAPVATAAAAPAPPGLALLQHCHHQQWLLSKLLHLHLEDAGS